jgi:CRISPR/Cas system CSM-associated protein Csm3 (group 7 of RAMP superfamily)
MTQQLIRRLEVHGALVCRSALSIGAWEESALADTAVARDGTGRIVVPGTSLAGAVRSWYTRHHGEESTKAIFGYLVAGEQDAVASRIRIDDAPLLGAPDSVKVQVRDGVRIDPRTGSAADRYLFTREVLPAGTRFAFRLTADELHRDGDHGPVPAAVHAVVSALAQGAVELGGSTSQGFGHVELQDVTIAESHLGSRDGLLAWLRNGPKPVPFIPVDLPGSGRLTIKIDWQPRHAVLVRDSEAGSTVDALPLTTRDTDRRVRLLIPGSSIKGALRAHAERIVRTLRAEDASADDQRSVLPAVCALFGTGPATPEQELPAGYRGLLRAQDCHSTGFLDAEDWDQVKAPRPPHEDPSATDSPDPFQQRAQANDERRRDREALNALLGKDRIDKQGNGIRLRPCDHVAIDRWTGGSEAGRLFSVLEPMGTAWNPIELSIDTRPRPAPHTPRPEKVSAFLDHDLQLALLLLVLRDLAEGWIPLGSGTTRGLGHLTATRISFTGDGVTGPWEDLVGRTLDDVIAGPPPQVAAAFATWKRHQALQPVRSGESRD